MNRAERNTIRDAAAELEQAAKRIAELNAENTRLAQNNKWLKARLSDYQRRAGEKS